MMMAMMMMTATAGSKDAAGKVNSINGTRLLCELLCLFVRRIEIRDSFSSRSVVFYYYFIWTGFARIMDFFFSLNHWNAQVNAKIIARLLFFFFILFSFCLH